METWAILVGSLPLLLVLVTTSASAAKRHRETTVRLARIERGLQLALHHLGVVEPEPHLPEVVHHIDNGNKIQAIKAYRQATGADLASAKEAVERMTRQRGL